MNGISMRFLYFISLLLLNTSVTVWGYGDPNFPGRSSATEGNCNADVSRNMPATFNFNWDQCVRKANDMQCNQLPPFCLDCNYSQECHYGTVSNVTCTVKTEESEKTPISCQKEVKCL